MTSGNFSLELCNGGGDKSIAHMLCACLSI